MTNKQKAIIELHPNRFKVVGPPVLVSLTQAIVFNDLLRPDEFQPLLNELWADWYVECSITGQPIPLCDLRYWDVAKQKVYARPELVPHLPG